MPRLRLAASLLAVALAAAACGGSGDEDVSAAPAAETTTTTAGTSLSTEAGAPAGPAVPEQLDFVAPDVRGGQVVGADFAGQDLVIWFWAPW